MSKTCLIMRTSVPRNGVISKGYAFINKSIHAIKKTEAGRGFSEFQSGKCLPSVCCCFVLSEGAGILNPLLLFLVLLFARVINPTHNIPTVGNCSGEPFFKSRETSKCYCCWGCRNDTAKTRCLGLPVILN